MNDTQVTLGLCSAAVAALLFGVAATLPAMAQNLDLDALARQLDRPTPDDSIADQQLPDRHPDPVVRLDEEPEADDTNAGYGAGASGAGSYRFPVDAAELAAYSAGLMAERGRSAGPQPPVLERTCQLLARIGQPETCPIERTNP